MVRQSPRFCGKRRAVVSVGVPGVHYASCETELASSSARACLSGAPCLALVGFGAIHVRHHASRESRARLNIAGGNGNWTQLVPPRVAPPRWHGRPLRCAQCSYRASADVALPAPSLPPPTLGSTATPARAEYPAAPRDAYRRDPPVARLV